MTLVLNGTTGVSAVDGSASTPAIQGNDTNTGVFFPAADTVAVATGGSERMRVDSSGNVGIGTSSPTYKLDVSGNGRVTGDFYVGASTNIIYESSSNLNVRAANALLFLTSGANERARIDSSGNLLVGTTTAYGKISLVDNVNSNNDVWIRNNNSGSSSACGVVLNASGNSWRMGMGSTANNSNALTWVLDVGGGANSEKMRLDTSGNLLVGTTSQPSSTTRLVVKGASTGSGDYGLWVQNSAGTETFKVRNDGIVVGLGVYSTTTGSAANMFVATDGVFYRSTSSLKYKRDVEDSTRGLADVMALRPVTYKGKSEGDGDKVFGGLIAEEVHEAGLTEFVQYAEDGSPDALAYGNMVSLCIKAIQELNAKVESLTAEIATLKGAQA